MCRSLRLLPVQSRRHWRAPHHPRLVLEVVEAVQRVDGGHPAEVQAEQEGPVVAAGVPHVLAHQHKVRPERAHHLGALAHGSHAHGGAGLGARPQGEVPEFRLLHPHVPVAVQLAALEVLGPGEKRRGSAKVADLPPNASSERQLKALQTLARQCHTSAPDRRIDFYCVLCPMILKKGSSKKAKYAQR